MFYLLPHFNHLMIEFVCKKINCSLGTIECQFVRKASESITGKCYVKKREMFKENNFDDKNGDSLLT